MARTDLGPLIQSAREKISSRQFEGARRVLAKALRIDPACKEAIEFSGIVAFEQGKHLEAIRFLQRAAALSPQSPGVHLNLGRVLHLAGRADDAVAALGKAAGLSPGMFDARLAYGSALLYAGKFKEALLELREAMRLNPRSPEAHYNIAQVFDKLNDRASAVEAWAELLRLEPESTVAKFKIAFGLQHLCGWKDYDARLGKLRAFIEEGQSVVGIAFHSLLMWDDARLHRKCADVEASLVNLEQGRMSQQRKISKERQRIRLAYVSADYRFHPTPRLLAGVLAQHDRSRFEVISVALNEGDDSPELRSVQESSDRFMDLHAVAEDGEIARKLREEQIDIAIDLMGHTLKARPGIFSTRAAPVQVNFLGFPGTSAIPGMDYIIVDPFIAAGGLAKYATEKLVTLPNCYQSNDRDRPAVRELPLRSSHGLPQRGFVFGSFNQHAKITPAVFDVWMRILRSVEDSVLWLLVYSEHAKANLKAEAEARGVSSSRLIFADNAPYDQHIARLSLVDLQLDTFPYNAHTTGSDALWVGCPIVTMPGESFPSRVCGSLLRTIGVPELVAKSWVEYEQIAVRLASDGAALSAIRARIADGREASPLFDARLFCRDLERAYEKMIALADDGRPPEDIDLSADPQVR